jgi:hypothetical protein
MWQKYYMPGIYWPFGTSAVPFWLLLEVEAIVVSAAGPSPDNAVNVRV